MSFQMSFPGLLLALVVLLPVLPVLPVFESASPVGAQEVLSPKPVTRADQLPPGVRRMHKALLRAARSGQIDNLRDVLQMNELMPLIDGQFISDPVAHWKSASPDHSGREILALLSELLELPPVKKGQKGSALYIWPWFAGVSLKKLEPSQLVQLYRLAPAKKVAAMIEKNHYSLGYLTIGADGTWHGFGRSFSQLSQ